MDNVATDLDSSLYRTSVKSYALGDHLAVCFDVLDSGLLQGASEPASSRPNLVKVSRPITSEKLDYFAFAFTNVHWDSLFCEDDAELCFDKFFNKFMDCYNNSFPTKTVSLNISRTKPRRNKYPVWSNQTLTVLKRWVLLAYDLYRDSRTPESHERYLTIKREYKASLIQAKKENNVNAILSSSNQCAAAWRVIKRDGGLNKAAPSTSVPPDEFNNFFVDSVSQVRDSIQMPAVSSLELLGRAPTVVSTFSLSPVTCEEVRKVILKLKNSTSKDTFDVSCSFLKLVVDQVVEPLTYCINLSFKKGVFPSKLKIARVIPIHKKGDWDSPGNFRPISILPVFSKVFESILRAQLCDYLESNGLLSTMQYGFRAGRSTVDAVSQVVTNVYECFQNRGYAGVTLCDLSKAFDTVDHRTLIAKLSFYGVKDVALELMRSYLTGRVQTVSVNGLSSEPREVTQGVPQGSIMGPLLFLVMVNDIVYSVPSKLICYADDTTIFCSSDQLDNLKSDMDLSLSDISVWFRANFFLLNESKTHSLIFSLRQVVNDVDSVKLLGIFLDPKLTWNCHINFVCTRLSRVIYLLRKLKDCVPKNWLKVAYCAFFQSIILYGLSLWGGAPGVKGVLLLQKKALRLINNADFDAHCRPIFKSESLLTVYALYIFQLIMAAWRERGTLELRSGVHPYNTRCKDDFEVPYVRLKKCQLSSNVLYLKLFNRIPCGARYLPESIFRQRLFSLLVENPLYSVKEFFELSDKAICKFF